MDSSLKTKNNGETQQYETQMEAHIKEKGKGGRTAQKIEYSEIEINGVKCISGVVRFKGTPITFLIDCDDFEKVKAENWYTVRGEYIGRTVVANNSIKVLYLHNFIMNRFDFPGKGAKESVDHINRDGLDNRKCNLRIVSQAIQNTNQKKRERRAQLPEGITELPKHVWYVKANGLHGDRFCIELKTEKVTWKTTSSKKVSIQDKLEQAKKKLVELYEEYPYLK